MSVDSNDVLQALQNADEIEKHRIQKELGIEDGHTRRDVLKGAAAVGGGAAIGAAASEMTGEAKADPSTSDSDGNLGLPGDRVDVFAEGIDAADILNRIASDADIHTEWNGLLSLYADTLGASDAIDPANTTTPLQDAINTIDSIGGATEGSGEVRLPRATFNEDSPTTQLKDNVTIIGKSIRGAKYGSEVVYTSTGATTDHGVEVVGDNLTLDRFSIIGPGAGNVTGVGMLVDTGDLRAVDIPKLTIQGWGNEALRITGNASPFEWDIGYLKLNGDAGDKTAVMNVQQTGPQNHIDVLAVSAADARTASDSTALAVRGSSNISINEMNVGSTVGVAADIGGRHVKIGSINYEPAGQNSASHPHIAAFRDTTGISNEEQAHLEIGAINHTSGTVDYAVQVNAGCHAGAILPVYVANGGTLNNSIVEVAGDPDGTIIYPGESSEVDNTSGAVLSDGSIWCQGDGVYKQSTGTGYDGGTDDRKV